jgi:hypothetical protein
MDAGGKLSQGVPIGNDISFLLAETVLAQVDKAMHVSARRAYRWFDDYEMSFDSREEAEVGLRLLRKHLDRFGLRLNSTKTLITELPQPTQDDWRDTLLQTARTRFTTPHEMVNYFDTAFRLREQFSNTAVLLYALGVSFRLPRPVPEVGRIAQSCITQALLSEPGAAQKAFALLSFWRLNGFVVDQDLIKTTIRQIILRHQSRGPTSDITWALAFCLEEGICLDKKAGQVLSGFEDDCIVLQALDMDARGLLPGLNKKRISNTLKNADLDREHWLMAYETVRQGYLSDCKAAVTSNQLFSELLAEGVTFYRIRLPRYALVVHPGGAPEWTVREWLRVLTRPDLVAKPAKELGKVPILELIGGDVARLGPGLGSLEDTITSLIDILSAKAPSAPSEEETYPV